jgi:antirestriction protein ArdC
MSTYEHTSTEKPDVYARVTSAIITAIEAGAGDYRMPWTDKTRALAL